MSQLTADRSSFLSLLLDEVTGTKQAINIRQDFCRLFDVIRSFVFVHPLNFKENFTGSKSEGLDLPGSDEDFMKDINDFYGIKITESLPYPSETSTDNLFYLCTKTTHPGFCLLRCVDPSRLNCDLLINSISYVKGHPYLSSNLLIENMNLSNMLKCFGLDADEMLNMTTVRQGPSIETWFDMEDRSESGRDLVYSIHCDFWPANAYEWIQRERLHGWPKHNDISNIVNFGCHVVAVGYPHSDLKLMEWRVSYSIAERTLVWSFNHIQIQCYAVMKLILKEFIKERCSSKNQVLCSYFVKTFLFWKFEATSIDFWRKENFGECIKYLLAEFSQCLRDGVLRHYFMPDFNLLSVKLTREAQIELLQLFDIIIQSDISIMKDCKTLRKVWLNFVQDDIQPSRIVDIHRARFAMTEELLKMQASKIYRRIIRTGDFLTPLDAFVDAAKLPEPELLRSIGSVHPTFDKSISKILPISVKTCLRTMLIKRLRFEEKIGILVSTDLEDKDLCRLHQIANDESIAFDLSTCKTWYVIGLLRRRDYVSCLSILNHILSSIPPFALFYISDCIENIVARSLFVDHFLTSECTPFQRAKSAWLYDLEFRRDMTRTLPLAIQVELYFSTTVMNCINISPFTCLHYLIFQCYHELCQNDERERALCQLVDAVNNPVQCGRVGIKYRSYNIAGHCLLIAGQKDRAREMFHMSIKTCEKLGPLFYEHNSAKWYLKNFC